MSSGLQVTIAIIGALQALGLGYLAYLGARNNKLATETHVMVNSQRDAAAKINDELRAEIAGLHQVAALKNQASDIIAAGNASAVKELRK